MNDDRAGKIMFEIFRDVRGAPVYGVVYYTELEEDDRDVVIERVMACEHVLGGFVADGDASAQAKDAIAAILDRLNDGESLETDAVRDLLASHLVP